jgi:hypothetical protein
MDFLRRDAAGTYLKEKFGHGSKKTLDKLATVGGGPEMVYSGRIPLYTEEALDRWARSFLSPPVTSTAERKALRHQKTAVAPQAGGG